MYRWICKGELSSFLGGDGLNLATLSEKVKYFTCRASLLSTYPLCILLFEVSVS